MDVNRGSRSLTIFYGIPNLHTYSLKNKRAVSSASQVVLQGINLTSLENRSTTVNTPHQNHAPSKADE